MFNQKFCDMIDNASAARGAFSHVFNYTRLETDDNNNVQFYLLNRVNGVSEKRVLFKLTREQYNTKIATPSNLTNTSRNLFVFQYIKDNGLLPTFYRAAKELDMHFAR